MPASAHQIAWFCSTKLDKNGTSGSFWTDQDREKSIIVRKADHSDKLDFTLSLNCSKRITLIKLMEKIVVCRAAAYDLYNEMMNKKDNRTINIFLIQIGQ
ncbi:MAG: hypothetical protein LBK68_03545 [Candidatus Margulisbacteria bacterium]|nr:hypothetical protein [Candidatus Margulisiibacteriota bacterium]